MNSESRRTPWVKYVCQQGFSMDRRPNGPWRTFPSAASGSLANKELGLLDSSVAEAIATAAQEVVEGRWDGEFVLDVYQTGSGTSTNMNANEVLARRAGEILGDGSHVHPNDEVNLGQSSNDVFPTAMYVAARDLLVSDLLPVLEALQLALEEKAHAFDDVLKSGRTHLMDATPVRLGQEFGGWARQVELSVQRVRQASDELAELALGGTATGTGINTHPEFASKVIRSLSTETGLDFVEASNHFEAQGAKDGAVAVSGALNTVAVSLMKVADDIRLLASGPTSGLYEITLPSVQPGSSIMPVLAHSLLESISLLAGGCSAFTSKCVQGIEANVARCRELLELNPAMATALNPRLGYDLASEIAKEATETGESIRRVVLRRGLIPGKELDELLDVRGLTEGGEAGKD